MKITKIQVNNFRLLKKFSIVLENDFSLIIGKNNTGKTSLMHILQKFLCTNNNVFNFEDFNLEFQSDIITLLSAKEDIEEENFSDLKLDLRIFVERSDIDSLENISDLILDLDPENKLLLLCFEYALDYEGFKKLKEDFSNHHLDDLYQFLSKQHKAYFKVRRKVIDCNDENNWIDIEDSKIQKIINLQTISAKRDVLNEDGDSAKNNKTLSRLSYKYFKPFEHSQASHVIDLQKELIKADGTLTKSYANIFKDVTESVKKFSYTGSKVSIKSNFQEVNLLKENTSVVYDENGIDLPEDYNGLGYLNLFAMIFELHIIFDEFKKTHDRKTPADINLLFVEEPEAHTHPQMQYVFIRNIKQFLLDNKESLNLQTIITTHSAHITSQSDFNDIKYFLNKNKIVEVKNLSELQGKYGDDDEGKANFKFLKQYLTLHKSELFFSDKIVFIEGDTERILLPAMMKKLDAEMNSDQDYFPLLPQKISVIEVGAHSKVFDKMLEFLEVKTLIITDLDSVKDNGSGHKVKCPVSDGTDTSNSSIKHYLPSKSWADLKGINEKDRILKRGDAEVYIAYQAEEEKYYARSFEDAFMALNLQFVKDNKDNFSGLKNVEKLDGEEPDFFQISIDCVGKKTEFATDILFYTNEDMKNWETPTYIKQGLIWLAKN